MSSIMDLIGPELSSYLPLNSKISIIDSVYTLASTNIVQSALNLVKMYMTIRSRMSLIMGQVIPDQLVFLVLEIEKKKNLQ